MSELNIWDVLRRPRITEKGTYLAEESKYVFEVHPTANKHQIKAAVERAWPNVRVQAVNVMIMPGKKRRWRRFQSTQADWKKAVVTLQSGQTIDDFHG